MPVFTALVPHPPIIVPDVGGRELVKVQKTVSAMQQLASDIASFVPDAMIVVSPHAPFDRGRIPVLLPRGGRYLGNLYQFGSAFAIGMLSWTDMAKKMAENAPEWVAFYGYETLDHAVLVPLYYLWEAFSMSGVLMPRMILVGYDITADAERFVEFGRWIRQLVLTYYPADRVLYLASGDLSHRLTPDAPSGYSPRAKEFDRLVVEAVKNWDLEMYLSIPEDLREEAGECGYLSFASAFGFAGEMAQSKVYSYEAPFGVGYLVAAAR